MNKYQQTSRKSAGLARRVLGFGSLIIGLPAIPLAASAQPISTLDQVNPCPGIYYEEPFNSRNIVPQGCTPNAATQRIQTGVVSERPVMRDQGVFTEPLTPAPPPTGVTQPPLPEERSEPIAAVMPMNGMVSVKLKNNTNAPISYEAVGHTQRRFLAGGEEIVLQGLPTPVTVTMVRQDEGLLDVVPLSTSDAGMLEVSLDEAMNLDDNQGVLRIQSDGQVFLN
jgi:hypothetical protein